MVKADALSLDGIALDSHAQRKEIALSDGRHIYVVPSSRAEVGLMTCSSDSLDSFDEFFSHVQFCHTKKMPYIIGVGSDFCNADAPETEFLLESLLVPFSGAVRQGPYSSIHGAYNDGTYIELMLQWEKEASPSHFASSLLEYLQWNSVRSIKDSQPNFFISSLRLLDVLEHSLGHHLFVDASIPRVIKGVSCYHSEVPAFLFNEQFVNAIVQPNGSSFTYSEQMRQHVLEITTGMTSSYDKSKAIFDWIITHIQYDNSIRYGSEKYRGALEVFLERKGICGESAALQVTMERLVGNKSFLVEVDDFLPQMHASAMTIHEDGKGVIIDTANKIYGADYQRFKLLSDEHSLARYSR